MATLLLSQGTPMISGGDEMLRTQCGNNNAYCHDDEISWYDWNLGDEQRAMLEFTRKLIRLRLEHPALHRAKFFKGRRIRGTGTRDIMWLRIDGAPMTDEDWQNPSASSLAMFLSGRGIDDVDEDGEPIVDDHLIVLLNASPLDLPFVLPQVGAPRSRPKPQGLGGQWDLLLDTADDARTGAVAAGGTAIVMRHSLQLYRMPE
jgi:glycogen operon protein